VVSVGSWAKEEFEKPIRQMKIRDLKASFDIEFVAMCIDFGEVFQNLGQRWGNRSLELLRDAVGGSLHLPKKPTPLPTVAAGFFMP
jgi:hypothetical protein